MGNWKRKGKQPDHAADTRGGRWVGIPAIVIDSLAYRNLSLWARAILVEVVREFNGYNNGQIAISFAQLTERLGNTNRSKISKAFAELVEHGLVDVETDGDWKQRHAREYRLTFVSTTPNDKHKPATNDYLNWKPAQKSSGNDALPENTQSGHTSLPEAKNAGHASLPLIVMPYPPGQSIRPKGDNGMIKPSKTPVANFGDPDAFDKAMRNTIGSAWKRMDQQSKKKLSSRYSVRPDEIRDYLKGIDNLPVSKLMEIRCDLAERGLAA